jgi:hypothetical protein
MVAMVTRSLGAVAPLSPSAEALTIVGKPEATTGAVTLRKNCLRFVTEYLLSTIPLPE